MRWKSLLILQFLAFLYIWWEFADFETRTELIRSIDGVCSFSAFFLQILFCNTLLALWFRRSEEIQLPISMKQERIPDFF